MCRGVLFNQSRLLQTEKILLCWPYTVPSQGESFLCRPHLYLDDSHCECLVSVTLPHPTRWIHPAQFKSCILSALMYASVVSVIYWTILNHILVMTMSSPNELTWNFKLHLCRTLEVISSFWRYLQLTSTYVHIKGILNITQFSKSSDSFKQ